MQQYSCTSNKGYYKQLLAISIPIIIQSLIFQIQTLINRAFLGELETDYLIAIGNTTYPFLTTISILTAVSTGLTIVISRCVGAKNHSAAQEFLSTSVLFNTILSTLLFVIWYCFSSPIFSLMSVSPKMIGYCNVYVKIMSLYLLFYGADISIQTALQGAGKTKPILFASIYKVFANIVLDYLLIFGNFNFPKMGLMGSAVASSIANISSTVILILYVVFSKSLPFDIKPKNLIRIKIKSYKNILMLGLPTGIESFAWYIGSIFLIKLLNIVDDSAVAMYSIILSISLFMFSFSDGIGRGSLPLVGHKIGCNDRIGAIDTIKHSIRLSLIIISVILAVSILFSKQILCVFTNDVNLANGSIMFFIITCIGIIPKSVNVMVGSGIRSLGDTKWMLYTQIFGTVFVIGFSCIWVYGIKSDVIVVYITPLVDEVIRSIINSIHLHKKKKALLEALPNRLTSCIE